MTLALELPPEISGETRVSVSRGNVLIENHGGIICFDDTLISLRTSEGKLSVMGSGLIISAMAEMKMVISGKVQNVEWER